MKKKSRGGEGAWGGGGESKKLEESSKEKKEHTRRPFGEKVGDYLTSNGKNPLEERKGG